VDRVPGESSEWLVDCSDRGYHLGPEDCILETDLGSANFSIDAQMKEIEQGFFDLLRKGLWSSESFPVARPYFDRLIEDRLSVGEVECYRWWEI